MYSIFCQIVTAIFYQYIQVQVLFPLLNMVTLSQELIHAVTDYVSSTTDLHTLCEVSRTFEALAEPCTFHIIHLTIHATSMQGLNNIHESDVFVEDVVFHYDDEWECAITTLVQEEMHESEDEHNESEGSEEDQSDLVHVGLMVCTCPLT